jgi:hypothetical protein
MGEKLELRSLALLPIAVGSLTHGPERGLGLRVSDPTVVGSTAGEPFLRN